MNRPMKNMIYLRVRSIPIVGSIFRIANAYAFKGEPQCNKIIAPWKYWWARIFKKFLIVLIFTTIMFFLENSLASESPWNPADTVLSIFPSILGFGIGVYALMFIMPSDFMHYLKRRYESGKSEISHRIIPVDMGYPLSIFIVVLCVASICKLFNQNGITYFASLLSLFYGLSMSIELMSFLFNSSVRIQAIRSMGKNDKQ
ncbi:hypothetical protein LOS07_16780 [Proteus mirabilis]|uniref:Phage protein n=1 Tax=Proteus mirabilis (strain HI4320) TaxID=529507 RepID=B4ETI5_PROMH|nr:hypothetical protein [Proteus mirabilis]MCD4592286.1 hypothetical protein [Proteus mirabilis]MCD4596043.1 hypothetical protein [Proteus mirabilis]MCD4599653.1 hypothetical protein [Proteus mirabilis]MCD4603553.1 hypothetical protein [Proteus mirabilis]MCD4607033.1 hypothetical protein [Proteus mirabilis]